MRSLRSPTPYMQLHLLLTCPLCDSSGFLLGPSTPCQPCLAAASMLSCWCCLSCFVSFSTLFFAPREIQVKENVLCRVVTQISACSLHSGCFPAPSQGTNTEIPLQQRFHSAWHTWNYAEHMGRGILHKPACHTAAGTRLLCAGF